MSKGARIFGLTCFWLLAVPYFTYTAYLAVVQDPAFVCGFKTFWGVDKGCLDQFRRKESSK